MRKAINIRNNGSKGNWLFFLMTFYFNSVSFSAQVERDKRAFVAAINKYFILDRLPNLLRF